MRSRTTCALVVVVLTTLLLDPGIARAQGVAPDPARPDGGAVQHGAQPDPGAVRPGTPDGDAPSAATGQLLRRPERRVLGLPVTAVLVIGGVIVGLLVLGWIVVPASRRRDRARGGGTYGR
jgi:hypothetical protein